jgi:hypothetical protein
LDVFCRGSVVGIWESWTHQRLLFFHGRQALILVGFRQEGIWLKEVLFHWVVKRVVRFVTMLLSRRIIFLFLCPFA